MTDRWSFFSTLRAENFAGWFQPELEFSLKEYRLHPKEIRSEDPLLSCQTFSNYTKRVPLTLLPLLLNKSSTAATALKSYTLKIF